jgi:saccharopine dehydrogenase-like NADP-dependent oxidoreductase
MSLRVVVLGGAGHIGSRIVKELHELDPTIEIVIADKNLAKADEVAKSVGGNIKAVYVDATVEEFLADVIKRADCVVNAIGPFYRFGVPILKTAIRVGVNFVDINDDYDATFEALKLHDEATNKGVTAVIGMGATPGITNILARHGAGKLDEVFEIGTYWIWSALDPTMGPAIIDHYFHAITGSVKTYRNGEWIEVKALSEPELYEFPKPIGAWEVAHVGHPEPITIPRYIKARNVYNKGGVWPAELNEIAKAFSALGITSLKEIDIKGQRYRARDIAISIVLALPEIISPELRDKALSLFEKLGEYTLTGVGLGVMVKGVKSGDEYTIRYGLACKDAAQATALPAALTALELAASKDFKKGVYPPEAGVVSIEKIINGVKKICKIEYTEIRTSAL